MGESIDPIAYDVVELRLLARGPPGDDGAGGSARGGSPDRLPPVDATAEYDRPAAWTGSFDERRKPYLGRLPRDEAARRLAREWVEWLAERAGRGGAADALAHYESVGWITESACAALAEYLPATDGRATGSADGLEREDHLRSLALVAELAAADGTAGEPPDAAPGPARAGRGEWTEDGTGRVKHADDAGRDTPRRPGPMRRSEAGTRARGDGGSVPDPGALAIDLPEDLAVPRETPYLRSLDGGPATDALALRWVAMLVERGGVAAALDAVRRYEAFGWIAPGARRDLEAYLSGPGLGTVAPGGDATGLDAEDDAASLGFVLGLAAVRRAGPGR